MNEEELKKYIKEKFKEIHTKMLNKQFVSAGTLTRFKDACIEFGKQEQKKEDLELMDKLLNNLGKHFKFVKGEASKCKDLDYFKATEDMERVSLGYIKQLQKEIGGMK